jgi:acetoin utilization protein AcuB
MTVQASDSISRAIFLMKEHDIRHLPVMEGEELVGIVSDRDLKEYSPSAATTLDVYELHYLLAKAKVERVMRAKPLRVIIGDPIEKAALLMHDNHIESLPVVDKAGALVGMLTDVDVFEALVRITGCRSNSTRMQMTIPDEPGSIKTVTDKTRSHGLKLLSILTTHYRVPEGKRELILRVEGDATSLEAELRGEYPDLVMHLGC